MDFAGIAEQCVSLIAADEGPALDGTLASLDVLDGVCERLLADGPLNEDRHRLWTTLIGAYTGEVLIHTYGGEWVDHDGASAIRVEGMTAFPFSTAARVLNGEPNKSLASFGRALPAVIENQGPRA